MRGIREAILDTGHGQQPINGYKFKQLKSYWHCHSVFFRGQTEENYCDRILN